MRMWFLFLLSILFIQCNSNKYRENDFYSEATLISEREKFLEKLINQTINKSLSVPLADSTEEKYMSAFWAMELIQYRTALTDTALKQIWKDIDKKTNSFQRAFLEVVCTLYQNEFKNEVLRFAEITDDPKLFAMCIHYINEIDTDRARMVENFKTKWKHFNHPIIQMLEYKLNEVNQTPPPLIDLLKNDFGKNNTIVFSFQRKNRDYPGLLIIKKPDGKFIRDESGEIFSVPQLARAVTDLPGYITNGNTPEGILSIQGTDVSKNIFIGTSPNLQLVLPYEVNPRKYFNNKKSDFVWDEKYYADLLPNSYKKYMPIYEAYYAGKAGRNEIIAHGTTIDPEFYKSKSFYPFTPSLGCLTTKEIWSSENGKIIESGQIKLMNALSSIGLFEGFFVVVNIDDQHLPVTLDEIEDLILKAER